MATYNQSIQDLIGQYTQQAQQAAAANEQRYQQALEIYDEIIRRYQPGGTFEARALEQLGARKTAEVGSAAQQMISSGLYGTEAGAGLGMAWERAVGTPARLSLEDIMMQRLSQAQMGKVGFMERREDVYPSADLLTQLALRAGQAAPTTYTATGGGGGPSIDFSKPLSAFHSMGSQTYGTPTTSPVTPRSQPTGGTPTSTYAGAQPTPTDTGQAAAATQQGQDLALSQLYSQWVEVARKMGASPIPGFELFKSDTARYMASPVGQALQSGKIDYTKTASYTSPFKTAVKKYYTQKYAWTPETPASTPYTGAYVAPYKGY